ncbi:hypothetical protein K438DRAFT_1754142 [Mycena galopus ATCC 62051]|nr:hypothetical protein K438DRAFT_1754142 [Mycena galopus ATCC 62051]
MPLKTVLLAVCVFLSISEVSPGLVTLASKVSGAVVRAVTLTMIGCSGGTARSGDITGTLVGGPVAIVNANGNRTIFTSGVPLPFSPVRQLDRYEVSTDAWMFKHCETNQWLTIDDANNHLITVDDYSEATKFAVESVGGKSLVGVHRALWVKTALTVKLHFADEVAEPLYEGTSPEYGRVTLAPATGTLDQRWFYQDV